MLILSLNDTSSWSSRCVQISLLQGTVITMSGQTLHAGLEHISNASSSFYSQLQVANLQPHAAPSANLSTEEPSAVAWDALLANDKPPPGKICGLRRITFWLALCLAVLAILARSGRKCGCFCYHEKQSHKSKRSGQPNLARNSVQTTPVLSATISKTYSSSVVTPIVGSASTPAAVSISVSTLLQTITTLGGTANKKVYRYRTNTQSCTLNNNWPGRSASYELADTSLFLAYSTPKSKPKITEILKLSESKLPLPIITRGPYFLGYGYV
ncbi:hypothetical protein B0J14DRAFT_682350 [Halenospora varia]|nr:hypothetical protein B0J14DRAFT_682350 [Halenospora varia]